MSEATSPMNGWSSTMRAAGRLEFISTPILAGSVDNPRQRDRVNSLRLTAPLARLAALTAFPFGSESVERLAADVQGKVPHFAATLGAGFGHLVEFIARAAGESPRLFGVLERARHADELGGDGISNNVIVGQCLEGPAGLGRPLATLLALPARVASGPIGFGLFLFVLRHAIPLGFVAQASARTIFRHNFVMSLCFSLAT